MSEKCGNGSNNELAKSLGIAGTLVFVTALMKKLFKIPPAQNPKITATEILAGARFREQFSAIDITSKILERQREIGIPIDALESGAPNLYVKAKTIEIEEITSAILTKLTMRGALKPTQIRALGSNSGGPIVVQGGTTSVGEVISIPVTDNLG